MSVASVYWGQGSSVEELISESTGVLQKVQPSFKKAREASFNLMTSVFEKGTGDIRTHVLFSVEECRPTLYFEVYKCAGLEIEARPVGSTVPIKDKLVQIQKSFGFNVSDTARILGVERRTFYLWQAGSIKGLHSRTSERLNTIFQLSNSWECLSAKPLAWARNETIPSLKMSVYEALVEESISVDAIRDAFFYVSKSIDDLAKRTRQVQTSALKNAAVNAKLPSQGDMAIILRERSEKFGSSK